MVYTVYKMISLFVFVLSQQIGGKIATFAVFLLVRIKTTHFLIFS